MKTLAQAYAAKRRAKLKTEPVIDNEPIEPWVDIPEEVEPAPKTIDVAAIVKKHQFFASKASDD